MEKKIRALLPHLRGRERLLLRLALNPRGLKAAGLPEEEKEALPSLVEEGLAALEGGRVRLLLALGREASPTEALAREHPHVRGVLLQAGKALPSLAHPLAREHPTLLLRAAEAALPYGRQAAPTLLLWLPKVREWAEAHGEERVAQALEEAARKAQKPFPYAERILEKGLPAKKEEEDAYLYI